MRCDLPERPFRHRASWPTEAAQDGAPDYGRAVLQELPRCGNVVLLARDSAYRRALRAFRGARHEGSLRLCRLRGHLQCGLDALMPLFLPVACGLEADISTPTPED